MTDETQTAATAETTTEANTEVKTTNQTAGAAKFTFEELEKFREEAITDNIKLREKNSEYKKQLTQLETQARKGAELEEQLTKVEQQARERLAKYDFKARLRSEGITDPDVLKLIDLSAIEYDDEGELKNADAVWDAFREAKPYLFGTKAVQNTSTSSVQQHPAAKATEIDWLTAPAEDAKKKPSQLT